MKDLFRIRQQQHLWKSLAGEEIIPELALIDRATAHSTQPPWSLVSEGLIEAELLDSYGF